MLALVPAAGRGERKKLEEVARHWARGDLLNEQEDAQAQDALDEQLALWGLVPDAPIEPEPSELYLWPENVACWDLFMELQTQWRIGAMGRTGLDYAAVDRVIGERRAWRLRRRQRRAEIRAMEVACLEEWARRSSTPEGS